MLLSLRERAALEKAPKLSDRPGGGRPFGTVGDVAGKLWNLPNTLVGLGYGLGGYAAGQLNRLRPGDQPDPRIQLGHNAVEFINNPFGGAGAITLGNTTTYSGDPYDPNDKGWYPNGEDPRTVENGHSPQEHEEQHTYQGQQLGPIYLPSNVAGLLLSILRGEKVDGQVTGHGPSNWNERGPQANPPTPWASRAGR
jgi:hypothetical protein